MEEVTVEKSIPSRFKILVTCIIAVFAIVLAVAMILHGNSFRSQPIFLFFMFVGLCAVLYAGFIQGGTVGLIIITLWVGLKRMTGSWNNELLGNNLLEILAVTFSFAMAGYYHDQLKIVLDNYYLNVSKLEKLDLFDPDTGLIKESVGRLRLMEEAERSVRYKRPFTLLLLQVNFKVKTEMSPDLQQIILRLTANTLKGTTRTTDIPFQAASDQIAIILPETNKTGGEKVVSNITNQLIDAFFISEDGNRKRLLKYAGITIGAAAFTGYSSKNIDLIESVKASLREGLANTASSGIDISVPIWKITGDESSAERIAVAPLSTEKPPEG